jgi:hypothetical protein
MTPGQPPAGAVPLGIKYTHERGVESEAVIVTAVQPEAAEALPAHTSAAARMATTTRTRPTKMDASAPLRCLQWIPVLWVSSIPASVD